MEWIAQHLLPSGWLGRHPGDDEERQQDRKAVERARDVTDKWNERIRESWREAHPNA
jgi:hypothetical protein